MPPLITSLNNQRIKRALRLRDRRGRDAQGRILIDGAREIRRAIESGTELVELFVWDEQPLVDDAAWVFEQALQSGLAVLTVSFQVLSKLVYGDRRESVVAVARTPERRLAELTLPPEPLIAVLQQVEKPGNVGAVIRTADAAGLSAVIVAEGGTDLYNPNTVRASLGTVFSMPLASTSSVEAIRWLREFGFQIFTARVEGAMNYAEVDYRGPVALVLGSETTGLPDCWRGDDITAVSLRMLGAADSLNVSATAAVLFYEALRQRSR